MKIVFWDLDDTLWNGTIYYGEKVTLKNETKEVLKQLDKLGIIQVACTHNALEQATEAIKEHGIDKYFKTITASVVLKKDEMIRDVLKQYSIAPEEALFVDDSVLNRGLVSSVLHVNVDYSTDLFDMMKYFDTERLVLMKQQRARETGEKEWTGDFKDFLQKIHSNISIKDADSSEVTRIANLANRTNELNATRARYTEEEINAIMQSPKDYKVIVAYLTDDYGDYGLVGEVICKKIYDYETDKKELFIQDICVSCRTMGRGVGKALLEAVKVLKEPDERLTGLLVQNKDNHRIKGLFESCGFIPFKSEENKIWYELQC